MNKIMFFGKIMLVYFLYDLCNCVESNGVLVKFQMRTGIVNHTLLLQGNVFLRDLIWWQLLRLSWLMAVVVSRIHPLSIFYDNFFLQIVKPICLFYIYLTLSLLTIFLFLFYQKNNIFSEIFRQFTFLLPETPKGELLFLKTRY